MDTAPIRAVYFGGTPTALQTPDLARLIRACYQYLPIADDCEFTIEGRMSHFDIEKAQACVEAGANRISIGVQTFDTAIRRRLGRKHGGDEAFAYLEKLCEINAVIVVDLMFGLPNQTDAVCPDSTPTPSTSIPCCPSTAWWKRRIPRPARFRRSGRPIRLRRRNAGTKGWNQVSNSHFAYPGRGEAQPLQHAGQIQYSLLGVRLRRRR